jgi:hypothetical protein
MSWLIEWKEYNPTAKETITNSDSWDKWEDVVRIFNECIEDNLCTGATVYCFWGENPYPSADDNIVLTYCP